MSHATPSRRSVLGLLGGGLLAAASGGLTACSGGGTGRATGGDAGGAPGTPLLAPSELRSRDGRLAIDLVAAPVMLPWGTGSRYALAYNGTVPGPTWRVRPGDVVTVRLRNDLSRPTNLHTHGLHVSPEGTSDDIFVMVDPGATHTYEYAIPADHPSGTAWYHPHHHGEVASQIIGGLAGAIVVEDALDDLFAGATERVLVLGDPKIGSTAGVLEATDREQQMGREGDVALVNGALRPTLTASAGSVERWRIVNASPSRDYRLAVRGATMRLVGLDTGRLDRPRDVDEVLLTPGQRAEVLIALDAPGTVTLATRSVRRGGMGGMGMGMGGGSATSPAADLLTVAVGAPATSTFRTPTALRAVPASTRTVDARRTVTLGAMGMGGGTFVIDGRAFAPGRVDIATRLGTVEEWTLRNDSMMDHPFHLHVWPMEVVSRSDGAADPGHRDTVNVPAGGRVVVRVAFDDIAGRTVYHCHILDHEDLGMMGTIEVR